MYLFWSKWVRVRRHSVQNEWVMQKHARALRMRNQQREVVSCPDPTQRQIERARGSVRSTEKRGEGQWLVYVYVIMDLWMFEPYTEERCVYFCVIPSSSSSPVQNELYSNSHTPLFTIRFGTFASKTKSGSKFHYSFWNFRSQIEMRKPIV